MTHSIETKNKAIQYFDNGHSIKKSAELASVSYSILLYWLCGRSNKSYYKPYVKNIERKRKSVDLELLKEFLKSRPNKTIKDLYSEWNGTPCHKHTFYIALKKVGYKLTREISPRMPSSD